MNLPARRSSFFRSTLALTLAAGLALMVTPAVSRGDEPLPMDPSLVTGKLENGLTYIVKNHATPKGHVAIWMHISSGSLNESERQRGLAHYLEHMAFNGSQNFPPGKVVPFFESLGLTFGRHQNAFTSFDQTTYQLDLGDPKPESLQKAMLFMSDVAFRLSLLPNEIDEERQVILNEKTARSGAQQRMGEYMLQHIAPESLIGKRIPIGTEETIKAVQKPDFESYYYTYYVPSNITVIVVGDTDPEPVVAQIKASFGDGKKVARPKDQDPNIKPTSQHRAIVATDAEITTASVSFSRILPPRPPTVTVSGLRTDLIDQIADFAFARRSQAIVSEGKASFFSCGSSVQNLFNTAMQVSVTASGKPEQWKALLTEAATELQRARLHGFTDLEIADAAKEILSGAEAAAKREGTVPARALLNRYNSEIAQGQPIMSAQQQLEVIRKVLPTIKAAEVSKQFTELFDTSAMIFTATLPTSADVPTESQLVELGVAALKVKPEKRVETARAAAMMEKVPAAGKAIDAKTHEASGVDSVWFENGIRVHYRYMDARKDTATVEITLAGGTINETAANRGITQAAVIGLGRGTAATKTLTSTQIRELMTGKKVSAGVGGGGGPRGGGGGGVGMDAVNMGVSGSPEDLEAGMQLAHLLLTQPKIEQAAFDKWKQQQKQMLAMMKMAPQGVLMEAMTETMYPKDEVRTKRLTPEQVDAITIEGAQKWLDSLVTTAPIEVSVVGDISKERAMELVATYLGSLPKRERITEGLFKDLRKIARPGKAVETDREITSDTAQSQVVAGFFAANGSELRDVRLLELASQVISSRMVKTIREEKQLVYSISAQNNPAEAIPGFGLFMAMAPTQPGKTVELSAAVFEVFDEFAKNGPTAEELDVAKKQKANTLTEQLKEPAFWTTRLATLDYRGRNLDDVTQGIAAYEAFTTDDVKAVFGKYNVPENRITVRVNANPKTDSAPAVPPAAPAEKPKG